MMIDEIMTCMENAEKIGVNLDYEPETVCEDIGMLTIEEWKELRKKGIGGSDAGTVLGVNHFSSKTELAMKKLGTDAEEKPTAKKQYTFDYGHAMEACLANYISNLTGWEVFTDNRMFRHPYHPFMIADCDAFVLNNEGYRCGLEFKTSGYMNKSEWQGGIYGRDALVYRPEYIWQIRHYMAVTNLYRWYLVISFSNSADDIVVIQVDRDLEAEKMLIQEEEKFWNEYVVRGVIPYASTYSKSEYDTLRAAANKKECTAKDKEIILPEKYLPALEEIRELNLQKSDLKKDMDDLEERINALRLPIIDELGTAEKGTLVTADDRVFTVTYKGQERKGTNYELLKIAYPDAYSDCVKSSFTRVYKQEMRKAR